MVVTFSGPRSGTRTKRVREEVKEGMAVIAFSAAASSALAVALMFVVHLAR